MTLSATLGARIRVRRGRRPERECRDEHDRYVAGPNAGDGWAPLSNRELLELSEAEWAWLREQGVTRPSPSGPTQPEAKRTKRQCLLRLAPSEIRKLDRIARERGSSRSEVVSEWIRQAR